MHVLISVDMEGISGVVAVDHVRSEHQEYERFRKLMTAEANAAIEGALEGGATRIVVNDSHAGMTNLLIENLHPRAELISGSPKPLEMMQGIGPDVDALFLIGYHGASGTAGAIMEHTWSRRVLEAQLNGRRVGEVGLNAALAGSFGVPVVLVTGDQAVTEEARALLGDIETVAVKEGITRTAACCMHPETAHHLIRQAAARALRRKVAPWVIPSPITLRVVFLSPLHADMARLVPGARRVDGRTVEWTGQDMPAVYQVWTAMNALASTVDR